MIYSVAAFAWVGGITAAAAVTVPTSDVVNGACYTVVFCKSQAARKRKKNKFELWCFCVYACYRSGQRLATLNTVRVHGEFRVDRFIMSSLWQKTRIIQL